MKQRSRIIVLTVVFLDMIGFGVLMPMLPFIAQSMGADARKIGYLAAAYPLTQLLFLPFWGKLSDRHGRRPVMLASVLGSTGAYVLFALAHSYVLLFVSRLLAGVMSANLGMARAYLVDISEKEKLNQNLGLFGAAQGLGMLVGPVLGSLLAVHENYFVVGLFCAGLSLITFILASIFLKESFQKSKTHELSDDIGKSLSLFKRDNGKTLFLQIFVYGILAVSFSQLFVAFPLLTQKLLGYGAKGNGYMFMLISFISILVQAVLFGKLAKKISLNHIMIGGLFIQTISVFFMGESQGLSTIIVTAVGLGIGYSLAIPAISSLIAKTAPGEEQGLVSGLIESSGGIGRIAGPLVSGFIISRFEVVAAFLASALVCGLALLTFLGSLRLPQESHQGHNK